MRTSHRWPKLLLFLIGICLVGVACAPYAAPEVSAYGAWPMEGYGPLRNRDTEELLALPLNPQTSYTAAGAAQYASPVTIADGVLYAEGDRKLHAIALSGGAERWQIDLNGSFFSPAVMDGTVFVRAESGNDGYVIALQADSGAKLWQYKFPAVGSAYDNIGGHVTSPVVASGLLIVGAAETIVALDTHSGREVWTYTTEFPVISSVSIANETLYAADFSRLYALDLKTGQERWRFDHGQLALYFAPILVEDEVAIAGYDTIYLLDRNTGKVVWSKRFDDTQVIPAGASEDAIYVKSTNRFWALDRISGNVRWNYAATNFVSLPAITRDQIYVVTRSDGGSQIRALAQADGQELWRVDQAGLTNAAPVVAGGRLYARTSEGNVVVFASS